jgi:hypothetical protein
MSERTPGAPVELRLRLDPALLAGALLILLQTVVRAVIVFPSFYWHDDFGHIEAARRLGLSQEFLVRDYAGHLEIGQYFVYWLVGRDAGLSFVPAALSLLTMQLIASCLLLAVLRRLFGRSPWLLLPFAGYLFTPLGLPVATWWAAGLQAMPLQIAFLLALLGLIGAVRDRSWRWAAVSVGGHALGLLFWEKALLIFPALLAVLVLVEWAGEPIRQRLRLLRAHWRLLLAHTAVVAGYLVLYLSVVDSSSVFGGQRTTDVVENTSQTVFRLLLPGLFGGPWTDVGAENTAYPYVETPLAAGFALLFLAVVAVSVWLRGFRALQAWLLVVGYVAVDITLLQVGRADFIGVLTRDPRYITDALPIIAIGVCAAFSGPVLPRRVPDRLAVPRPGATSRALAATAFLISSCLLSSFLLADELQHEYARNYVHGVVRALDQNPDVAILASPLPAGVSVTTDLAHVLRAMGRERELDRPGTDTRMFDGLANLRPITVIARTLEAAGPTEDCGWVVDGTWRRLGTLPSGSVGPQVLRLGYVTGQAATLHLRVGGHEQALALEPGVGLATFVVTGQDGPVRVRVTDVAFGGICVTDVVAGAPWPE